MSHANSPHKELPSYFKLATIWLLLMLLVFLGFKAWERQQKQSLVSINGGEITLRRASDGHFHWPGEVNGVAVDFLVDTGATSTALPQALAEQVGLRAEAEVASNTAGGVARGYRARADVRLQGGVNAQRLPVTVLPALDAPLLGMDILSKLSFTQHGGELLIRNAKP
ncbi:retropepsin-like aspartic protease family protein [Roseateles sp. PN1]|uniref:retropepsin-like aspartic protease family protein n=1 Tax=Roseateles sp. PN1 TaxID=3137372 RepID=UPI003138D91A